MHEEIVLFDDMNEVKNTFPHLKMKSVTINKKSYGIVRVNGDVFIFEKYCPHADYDLTQGKISPLGRIVCPWHNYQFDLMKGDEKEQRCRSLKITKAYFKNEKGLCCKLPI